MSLVAGVKHPRKKRHPLLNALKIGTAKEDSVVQHYIQEIMVTVSLVVEVLWRNQEENLFCVVPTQNVQIIIVVGRIHAQKWVFVSVAAFEVKISIMSKIY